MTTDSLKQFFLPGKSLFPSWIVPDPSRQKPFSRILSHSRPLDSGCALYKALRQQARNH